jgi:hypothetical protein
MADIAARLRALREGSSGGNGAQSQAERLVARAVTAQVQQKQQRESHVLRWVVVTAGLALAVLAAVLLVPGLTDPAPLQIVQPAPAPAPAMAKRPPPKPAATADPLQVLVQEYRQRIAAGASAGWSTLEGEGIAVAAKLPEGSQAAAELRLVRQQLADDAEAWYKAELGKLPPPGQETVGARLTALSRLRDEVGAAERLDADVRYQEELAILLQRLNEARRLARRALEAGQSEQLPALAGALAPAFAGTPFVALQRHFALLCSEAVGLKTIWNTDWRTTTMAFERHRGERAIAAAAALLLTGDPGRAKRVLLADPSLASGQLLRRREALIGGLAAVLTFDDPADIQYLDIVSGEPVLGGGALRGPAGQAASLVSTVPVGGADWMAEVVLQLAGEEAEVVLSCQAGGETVLLVRLAEGRLLVRHRGSERTAQVAIAGSRRVRLSARGARLIVVLDGREVAAFDAGAIAAGAQLRLDLAGSAWRLEEMQVVGGR